jgi:hypothetical protein
MAKTSIPKLRVKSAGTPDSQLEQQIHDALAQIPLPGNVFCEPGIAQVTLENALGLLQAVDRLSECEGGALGELLGDQVNFIMGCLRQTAIDAVNYAHELVYEEDEMRGAARLALHKALGLEAETEVAYG